MLNDSIGITDTFSISKTTVAEPIASPFQDGIKVTGEVRIFVRDENGNLKDEIKHSNLVTTVGKGAIASLMKGVQAASNLTVAGAATSSGLINIQTSTSHGLQTGQDVFIYNVAGTTEANGFWVITKVDATHFTLNGSTFTNAYTSGGTIFVGPAEFSWMGLGTGTTAAAVGDTDLQTELTTPGATIRAPITRTNPTSTSILYSATFGAGVLTNSAIAEAGIFNDSAFGPSSGTILAHVVFGASNKGSLDSWNVQWSITLS